MEKYKQIKRNHHYVWSHYLRSWVKDKEVFYISQKGKVARSSVKGIAKETNFYKITPLNEEDIVFLKKFSSYSPVDLQKLHMAHLGEFMRLSKISESITNLDSPSEELKNFDKVLRHNSLEDMHSFIEQSAIDVMSRLAQGDSECLKSEQNMVALCSYLGHQISRTKAFKEKTMNAINADPSFAQQWPTYLIQLEKNWWFLSFMFGLNIGISLYTNKDRDNHIFITNTSALPFITSDNPIINVHSSLDTLPEGEMPTSADFYIPLSPKYAYMINNSESYNDLAHSIDENEIMKLNQLMYKKSHETVFSNTDSVLIELKSSGGKT